MNKKHTVFLVDDHPIVREGLKASLALRDDLQVCGEADDVDTAIREIRLRDPELVLVDLHLQSGHGLDLIRQIKAHKDSMKVLVVSMMDESLYGERAFRAGAVGYVNKTDAAENLLEAIKEVLDGKFYMSAELSQRLIHRSLGRHGSPETQPVETLSDRELEVFELIGQGLTTRQVADRLYLSHKTVETHRENIKSKLGVQHSTELVRLAVEWVLNNQ